LSQGLHKCLILIKNSCSGAVWMRYFIGTTTGFRPSGAPARASRQPFHCPIHRENRVFTCSYITRVTVTNLLAPKPRLILLSWGVVLVHRFPRVITEA